MSGENSGQPPNAVQVCADIELGDEATPLLRDEYGAEQFLNILIERLLYDDAIKVLGRFLAKQAAVKWACGCLEEMHGRGEELDDPACLDAANAWWSEPSEDHRIAAMKAAEQSGYQTSAAWAAAAAGWSGGSLAPPDMPVVPPPDELTAKAIAGSVALLASNQPEELLQRQLDFVRKGVEMTKEPGCVNMLPEPAEQSG